MLKSKLLISKKKDKIVFYSKLCINNFPKLFNISFYRYQPNQNILINLSVACNDAKIMFEIQI